MYEGVYVFGQQKLCLIGAVFSLIAGHLVPYAQMLNVKLSLFLSTAFAKLSVLSCSRQASLVTASCFVHLMSCLNLALHTNTYSLLCSAELSTRETSPSLKSEADTAVEPLGSQDLLHLSRSDVSVS